MYHSELTVTKNMGPIIILPLIAYRTGPIIILPLIASVHHLLG
jgi:hypothetical protein